jgi:heme-degrading monooxygenase HmoA
VHARMTKIQFPASVEEEVARVARGLAPVLERQRGSKGLDVIMSPDAGEGIIITFWETVADAEAGEGTAAYIGQMSRMSSFLSGRLNPQTYEVSVRT